MRMERYDLLPFDEWFPILTQQHQAVAFGYFEALIHLGDVNKLGMEQARIRSLNNVMSQAGFSMDLVEDFADETLDLLREITSAVGEGRDAASVLLEKFNDDMVQNYIISHLRVSWEYFIETCNRTC